MGTAMAAMAMRNRLGGRHVDAPARPGSRSGSFLECLMGPVRRQKTPREAVGQQRGDGGHRLERRASPHQIAGVPDGQRARRVTAGSYFQAAYERHS
jgi:hypothetical protein